MSTRAIRTSTQQETCDVCGRTLLRGERSEIYLAGTARHSVCELCTSRALHGGWIREGTVRDYGAGAERIERRRSLLRRRRSRRDGGGASTEMEPPAPFGDGQMPLYDGGPSLEALPLAESPAGAAELDPLPEQPGPAPEWPEGGARPADRRARRRRGGLFSGGDAEPPAPERGGERRSRAREPRHVHAVPTSVEHKMDDAIELFNGSEHPRRAAGITRSLGLPDVSVHPTSPVAAVVNIVLAWELCWYRYEVDLSDEVPAVRGAGQGYELTELTELERSVNAVADETGRLSPGEPTWSADES